MFGLENAQSLVGVGSVLLICWAVSENRGQFPWKLAIGAILTQAILVMALFGLPPLREALQGVALRRRDVDRVEPRPAERRHRREDVGVGEIRLGVLGQVTPQRLHPRTLDAHHLDPGIAQPVGHGEPAHPGRLHQRLDGVAVAQVGGGAGDEGVRPAQRSHEPMSASTPVPPD